MVGGALLSRLAWLDMAAPFPPGRKLVCSHHILLPAALPHRAPHDYAQCLPFCIFSWTLLISRLHMVVAHLFLNSCSYVNIQGLFSSLFLWLRGKPLGDQYNNYRKEEHADIRQCQGPGWGAEALQPLLPLLGAQPLVFQANSATVQTWVRLFWNKCVRKVRNLLWGLPILATFEYHLERETKVCDWTKDDCR